MALPMDGNARDGRRQWGILPLLLAGALLGMVWLAGPVASQPLRPQWQASGGGEYAALPADALSTAERASIEAMLRANIDRLTAEGRLAPAGVARVALGWPLAGRQGFADPGYHAITGFVDHNPSYSNQLLDYACGGRTYDTSSGYNHQGTDFYLWPFAWNKMAAGDVVVVAAADGVIIGRREGNPDQSCNFNSNPWNAVYVRHADGTVAWYGHLKRNTVTMKAIGDTVTAGEYLGLVGSSGNSTGPHLHFELYDNGQLTDPYAGSCNPLDGGSWWTAQPPYYDSAVNKLTTGTAPVDWGACPQPDLTFETQQFLPGDSITFSAYFRDQLSSQTALYRIVAPDGLIYAQWSHNSPATYYLSYWWWTYNFPVGVPTGTWRFEVEFEGQTVGHDFMIGELSTMTPTPTSSPTATPSATPSPTPTATVTPTLTATTVSQPPALLIFIPAVLGG